MECGRLAWLRNGSYAASFPGHHERLPWHNRPYARHVLSSVLEIFSSVYLAFSSSAPQRAWRHDPRKERCRWLLLARSKNESKTLQFPLNFSRNVLRDPGKLHQNWNGCKGEFQGDVPIQQLPGGAVVEQEIRWLQPSQEAMIFESCLHESQWDRHFSRKVRPQVDKAFSLPRQDHEACSRWLRKCYVFDGDVPQYKGNYPIDRKHGEKFWREQARRKPRKKSKAVPNETSPKAHRKRHGGELEGPRRRCRQEEGEGS